MTRIETERLILRPIQIDDAHEVFEWAGDQEVNKFMPYPLHDNVSQTEGWIRSLGEDKNEFVFCLRDSGEVIGGISMSYHDEYKAYELGYNMKRKYWGAGYATEASKAMIQWAYEELGVHDFFAKHANANYASGNVIRKCGFQFEKYGKVTKYNGSESFDASYYRLHID